jgi:hypothetical protein
LWEGHWDARVSFEDTSFIELRASHSPLPQWSHPLSLGIMLPTQETFEGTLQHVQTIGYNRFLDYNIMFQEKNSESLLLHTGMQWFTGGDGQHRGFKFKIESLFFYMNKVKIQQKPVLI